METNFNFNSQVCTSRSQSERLLALGLKKETADMIWTHAYYSTWAATAKENPLYFHEADEDTIPAWSLHRLLCLYGQNYEIKELYNNAEECYGMLISAIGIAIEEGDFNEEYLNKEE